MYIHRMNNNNLIHLILLIQQQLYPYNIYYILCVCMVFFCDIIMLTYDVFVIIVIIVGYIVIHITHIIIIMRGCLNLIEIKLKFNYIGYAYITIYYKTAYVNHNIKKKARQKSCG